MLEMRTCWNAVRHLNACSTRRFATVSSSRPKFIGQLPEFARIVEVGPRDGLQNEKSLISTDHKVQLINSLVDCGIKTIEPVAFVSPKWIPQAHDSADVMKRIDKPAGVAFPVLVPNMKGFEQAMEAGVKEIAIFVSASEKFAQKNTNCSVEESFTRLRDIVNAAKKYPDLKLRGYVSCVMGCPYEGTVPVQKVVEESKRLFDLGCYEISLGDTIGVGTPAKTYELITELKKVIPVQHLALHAHATYGQALVNILTALQLGVNVFDSSVAGLGGCPYAKGATGNACTEDLVYMLNGLGVQTGIDLEKLVKVGTFISGVLGRKTQSKVGSATEAKGSLPPGYDRCQ